MNLNIQNYNNYMKSVIKIPPILIYMYMIVSKYLTVN